jgi:glycosyltransferase involved in cell wall biosynthesis
VTPRFIAGMSATLPPDDTAGGSPAAAILALGPLQGQCRLLDASRITGWARNDGAPSRPVVLELLLDGEVLGSFAADRPRPDLATRFPDNPQLGFAVQIPRPIATEAARTVELRRAADLAPLPGSPLTLPHTPPPPDTPERQLAALTALLDSASRRTSPAARADLATALAPRLAELLPARPPRQAALLARWGAAGPGTVPPTLPPRRAKQALVIDDGVPDPARDAGSAALVSHMQALLGLGYEVGFVPALGLGQGESAASRALAGMGVTCWHLPWAASVEEVLRRDGPALDLVYLHRHGPMQRYAALARHWAPQARLVYSLADLHWLRAWRAHMLQDGAAREAALATGEAALPPDIAALRHAELTAILAADAVITHSSHEAALLAADAPEAAVHLLPWAIAPRPVTTPFAARAAVAFVGSYGHAPNLDAAHTLLAEVMPAVWAQAPAIPLLLAGSDLPASLRAAAAAAPGPVEVPGHLPDLAALWERTRLSAAPLRYGAGLKGKVLDSLAAGIPCLCSETAAEGMDLPPALASLVAPSPAAMAAAILRLHPDEAACAALAAAGLAWIEERFSAARIQGAMRAVAG